MPNAAKIQIHWNSWSLGNAWRHRKRKYIVNSTHRVYMVVICHGLDRSYEKSAF